MQEKVEKPSETDSVQSQISSKTSRQLVGKRTAQRDTIKDNTSDSQVNSYIPYSKDFAADSLCYNLSTEIQITRGVNETGMDSVRLSGNFERYPWQARLKLKTIYNLPFSVIFYTYVTHSIMLNFQTSNFL